MTPLAAYSRWRVTTARGKARREGGVEDGGPLRCRRPRHAHQQPGERPLDRPSGGPRVRASVICPMVDQRDPVPEPPDALQKGAEPGVVAAG
jgi:hypothetical protein